jgi:hypothetical protein
MSSNIFKAAIREGTFLDRYMQHMSALETPLAYDFWCGMWLISAAVGRQCYVARPKAPVRLNLYAVLCADAGTTRKSTSVSHAETILHASGIATQYTLYTSSTSPEAFVQRLAKEDVANAAIVVSELVTFLGRETYSMGMPGVLTDLYDCPASRIITRANETFTLSNVYVTFLSASTPAWLVRAINPDVIEGGFTSRCLFIVANEPKQRVAWPQEDDNADVAVHEVGRALANIAEGAAKCSELGGANGGAIHITPTAKAAFTKWYEQRQLADQHDPFLSSFEAREDHHVLRVAALLSANEGSFMINAHHIGHAIKIVKLHKGQAARVFGGGKLHHKLVVGIDKLRDYIYKGGVHGVSKTAIIYQVRHFMKAAELDFALAIMHELGMINVYEIPTGGRQQNVYRGTNRLMLKELRNLVQERMFAE